MTIESMDAAADEAATLHLLSLAMVLYRDQIGVEGVAATLIAAGMLAAAELGGPDEVARLTPGLIALAHRRARAAGEGRPRLVD